MGQTAGYFTHQLPGQRQFGVTWYFLRAAGIHEQQGIVILPEGVVPDIANEQRNALFLALHGAVFEQVF